MRDAKNELCEMLDTDKGGSCLSVFSKLQVRVDHSEVTYDRAQQGERLAENSVEVEILVRSEDSVEGIVQFALTALKVVEVIVETWKNVR